MLKNLKNRLCKFSCVGVVYSKLEWNSSLLSLATTFLDALSAGYIWSFADVIVKNGTTTGHIPKKSLFKGMKGWFKIPSVCLYQLLDQTPSPYHWPCIQQPVHTVL